MPEGQQGSLDLKSVLPPLLKEAENTAKSRLDEINQKIKNGKSIDIGDMFNMQMEMNRLSQLVEMSTGIASAQHSALISMARNVKG